MKQLLIFACLCIMPMVSFAQDEKPESNRPASPEMTALQTAAELAKYGYTNNSASALIEAAKIFAETPTRPFDGTKEPGAQVNEGDKVSTVSFDPAKLLADAKELAGKDKTLLACISQVESTLAENATRGALGGPKYAREKVNANSTDRYTISFWANELAEVTVVGDGDNDLDLYIYDENGNKIASDTDYTDTCVCRWVPSWTGAFTIKVVNRGQTVYSNYVLMTN